MSIEQAEYCITFRLMSANEELTFENGEEYHAIVNLAEGIGSLYLWLLLRYAEQEVGNPDTDDNHCVDVTIAEADETFPFATIFLYGPRIILDMDFGTIEAEVNEFFDPLLEAITWTYIAVKVQRVID